MKEKRPGARFGLLLVAVFLVGCQASTSVVPPSEMKIGARNETTKAVVLVVNRVSIKNLDPGSEVEVAANALPPLPWTAEVRLQSGRSLLSLTIRAGDVLIGPTSQKGDGTRVDLSCGRIDLWSGPALMGPAPQPGTSGDCDP